MTDSGLFWAARQFYTRFDWPDQNEQNSILAALGTVFELDGTPVNSPFEYLPVQVHKSLLWVELEPKF